MFLNQPQFPTFYTWNDIQRKAEAATLKTIDFNKEMIDNTIAYFDSVTENNFTTYTKKVVNLNKNIAEDAKKIIKAESKESKA
jgi:hypothetical protein